MSEKENNSDNSKNFIKDYAPYLGLGLQLAVTIVVMVFAGIWLDKQFNTSPYLTVACSFFGIFAALYNFIKAVIKSEK